MYKIEHLSMNGTIIMKGSAATIELAENVMADIYLGTGQSVLIIDTETNLVVREKHYNDNN